MCYFFGGGGGGDVGLYPFGYLGFSICFGGSLGLSVTAIPSYYGPVTNSSTIASDPESDTVAFASTVLSSSAKRLS